MAALGSQSIASSYEQILQVDRDGGGNSTTHVSVKDGDNGTTFGFTIASDALMMSSTNRLEFGDTGTYIHQSADGVLDLVSDTEIEINATTIDMNGAVDISGNAQLSGTVTVGADGSGTDVIFYSGTAGDNFTWDASDEKLIITGTNGTTALDVADGNVSITDDLAVDGTSKLDNTDIDGTFAVDGTTISLDATTSLNIDNSNTSNGITVGTATSGVPISIGHTTSETTVNDNLVITGNIDANGDSNFQGDITTQSKILIAASGQGVFGAADGNTGIRWEGSDVLAFDTAGTERLTIHADGDITTAGNIVIDADAKGITLGDGQDATIFSNATGDIYFTSGTDVTPVGSDTEGWFLMDIGTTAETTFSIVGGEANHANLKMMADQADGDGDTWVLSAKDNASSGDFTFSNDATGSLVTNLTIDTTGAHLNPVQPAFLVTNSSDPHVNFAIDTTITHTWNSEAFDQGGDFTSNTFTAPVTGKYQLSFHFYCQSIDSDSTGYAANIVTSNRTYSAQLTATMLDSDGTNVLSISVLADMDASDSAYCTFRQDGGAQQSDGVTQSTFSGFLAC